MLSLFPVLSCPAQLAHAPWGLVRCGPRRVVAPARFACPSLRAPLGRNGQDPQRQSFATGWWQPQAAGRL